MRKVMDRRGSGKAKASWTGFGWLRWGQWCHRKRLSQTKRKSRASCLPARVSRVCHQRCTFCNSRKSDGFGKEPPKLTVPVTQGSGLGFPRVNHRPSLSVCLPRHAHTRTCMRTHAHTQFSSAPLRRDSHTSWPFIHPPGS